MALSSLQSFKIKLRLSGWVYLNGKKGSTTMFGFSPSSKRGARVFEKLMNIIIEEMKKRK
jgi:hypothetical protein